MALKFTGGGNLPGVPMRDLSDADIAALDDDAKAQLDEHMKLPTEARIFSEAPAKAEKAAPKGE